MKMGKHSGWRSFGGSWRPRSSQQLMPVLYLVSAFKRNTVGLPQMKPPINQGLLTESKLVGRFHVVIDKLAELHQRWSDRLQRYVRSVRQSLEHRHTYPTSVGQFRSIWCHSRRLNPVAVVRMHQSAVNGQWFSQVGNFDRIAWTIHRPVFRNGGTFGIADTGVVDQRKIWPSHQSQPIAALSITDCLPIKWPIIQYCSVMDGRLSFTLAS